MTKPSREVERIEQLLAGPWAIDTEEHESVKNTKNYLFVTMKNMFEYWYNDINAQRANQ